MAKQNPPKIVTKKHIARLERERRQVNLIRGIALGGILIVVALLVYGYLRFNVLVLREPVAEVNGEVITTGAWQQRVRFQRAQLVNFYSQYSVLQQSLIGDFSQQMQQISTRLNAPEFLGQEVIDQMIDEVLIRQEAQKLGITVTAEEIEASIRETFRYFPDGTPTPTVTPTEVELPTLTSQQLTLYPSTATPTEAPTSTPEPTATLDPSTTPTPTATTAPPTPTPVPPLPTGSPTPYTLDMFETQYKEMLDSLGQFDISEQTVRSVYEADLYREKLMAEITKDVEPTEEQVWARHILVSSEAETRAVMLLLNQGVDFAEVARRYSEDTGSGANGGDLGWFGRGTMVTEFEEAAFSLEIGEISEPVQSQFGYHIIQVLGHQENPLNASQFAQKKETAFTEWLSTVREQANITTYDTWREYVPTEPSLPATVQ
jgi:peptidyl-prolyl cis-trans isomerase D